MAKKLNLILLLALVVGLPPIEASADGPPTDAKKPAVAANPGQPAENRVLVTIGRETTLITQPLRKDGYPDYVAALNEIEGKDVSPQDNGVVLLWEAIGPAPMRAADRPEYFRLLSTPVPSANGEYFVPLDSCIKQEAAAKGFDSARLSVESAKIDEELESALKAPWSKQEHPLLAAWLVANEKPLRLVVEASRRSKFFDPLVIDQKSTLLAALIPLVQFERQLTKALVARATLQLHGEKTAAAWQDLLAAHRLARLSGRGPTLVQALVADSCDASACSGDQVLLQSTRLTAAELMRMREDLARLPPLPDTTEKVDRGERFMYLDAVRFVATKGLSSLAQLTGGGEKTIAESALDLAGRGLIDWNVPLREGNSWYDRLVQAIRKPSEADRVAAFHKIDGDLRLLVEQRKGWKLALLTSPRQEASQRVGNVFVFLFLPAISSVSNAEHRVAMNFELTKLAFSLSAYRADHGEYPAKLDELSPKYAAEIPRDVFTAEKLHYRRDGDGYLLYSVGSNQIDDGGRSSADDQEGRGWDDIVVRMPKSK